MGAPIVDLILHKTQLIYSQGHLSGFTFVTHNIWYTKLAFW